MVMQVFGPKLERDLARIEQDGSIRIDPLLSGPAAKALPDAIALIQDTFKQFSQKCVWIFKICICYDPVHRWRGEDWSYVHEGYDFMQLLMWSTATECKELERLTIDHFHGTTGCANQSRGGDGLADSDETCYCYIVFADVSSPQWGKRRLRRRIV